MLVTFVSQCEKKALRRTRRILDAFANRIGDNVWQTAITEEGLTTVKRLLRQSATRSMAVSCHRVRTRQRTELVWIVGNKRKFNEVGFVPVNWTTKEVFMDLPIATANILANTNKQPLSQHLFAVGYLGYKLIERLGINHSNLAKAVYIAGILHDIGKIDPQFQNWLTSKIKKQPKIDNEEDLDLPDLPNDGVHIDASIRGHTKFTFEKHPRHHEISWLLAQSILPTDTLNSAQTAQIFHGIYWHHTRPFRKDNRFFSQARGIHRIFSKSLETTTLERVMDELQAVLKEVQLLSEGYAGIDTEIKDLTPNFNYKFNLTQSELPSYKNYDALSEEVVEFTKDIKPNALNNLVRMAVISADRIVSKMSKEDLADYLREGNLYQALDAVFLEDSHLVNEIEKCLIRFESRYPNSERNHSQNLASTQLADLKDEAEFDEGATIGVLQGPAGCGKTKIALEWALKTNAQKIIWVCPRVQVCLGLLNDLTQDDYLPNSRIEIFTGEYKKIITGGQSIQDAPDTVDSDYFSGDIVITTIDQVINNIISHNKVTSMVDFMQAHVVFDEFHELIPMPAFNLLFAELIEAKKCRGILANTLLVSATPHDYFVKKVLNIKESYFVRVESFNSAKYQLQFKSYDETEEPNPLITNKIDTDKTTFVITNTAQDAQLGFLRHQNDENSILIHSKYTRTDKVEWFNKVFNCFKRNGNGQYQVLRSGPIVQASLNITCEQMYTDLTSAENWLQRLGRLDRFGEHTDINQYITVIPQSVLKGKQNSHQAKFLASLNVWNSALAWLNYLQNYMQDNGDDEPVTLNQLYTLYKNFYKDDQSKIAIEEDTIKSLKQSVQLINDKVVDPISVPPKSKCSKEGIAKMSKNSLRGNNRFVQMAVCEVDNNLNPTFINQYAYDEDSDHSKVTIGLTESVERIQGYGDGAKNLVAFMQAKHHNIKKEDGAKKAYNDYVRLNEARSPESPIYLSYTTEDLESIGGERERHPYAMYYVLSKKQPVGTMSIDQLNNPDSVED
ncbi:CRISPR-associated helicase Cas3' [Psychrobacter sp. H7-1]|uniref:CRISPR-associated helicase Cas3' n=1 Tax=Psychrobacter sp. H7-1 TaxID=1569265 RepID=UPI001919717A|nr:CRISPR-associated helicase Cas3' [Psychrobacter sp. H7-1]